MSGNFAIKGGGGVGRLMANAILNFHFDYLNPSLSCIKQDRHLTSKSMDTLVLSMFRRKDVDVDIDIDDVQEDGRLEISLVGRQEEGEYWCQAKDR